MKRVIFYVLMLPMVLGMMISCSEAKTDAKKLEGKWNVVEVKDSERRTALYGIRYGSE